MSPSSSGWKISQTRNQLDADSEALKMEAKCSSETLANFQRTTRRCIPELFIHNHRCENLKSILLNGSTVCEKEEIGSAFK
jgi:hypothetical protein